MKARYILLILISLTFINVNAQEDYGRQFKNSGFEEWIFWGGNNNRPEPIHWHGFKSGVGPMISFTPHAVSKSEITRPGSSGKYSAKVQVKKIIGMKANGTLINGRMNAGSMSLAATGNYIFTDRSHPEFCTPIDILPDSITIWLCFRAESSNDSAYIHTAIHGDGDFRLVSDATYHPKDLLVAKGDGYATAKSSPKSNDYFWERVSVPFIVDNECKHPHAKYVLASFSTNHIAGKGSDIDELFIDDVLLIYNPTLKIGGITKSNYTVSDYSDYIPIEIPYSLVGTMSPSNLNKEKNNVIAELSDEKGSFSSPTVLGSIKTNTSGTISGKIPKNKIKAGNNYQIRIRTTNYPMTSKTVSIRIN